MRDDMIAGENEENRYVGSLRGKKGIAELAAMIRETLSLPSDWYEAVKSVAESFRLLREAISRVGVLVMMKRHCRGQYAQSTRCFGIPCVHAD